MRISIAIGTVDISEACPWKKTSDSTSQHHVLIQVWPVNESDAQIVSDIVPYARLEKHSLYGLCPVEPEIVIVRKPSEPGSYIEVDTRVVQSDTRVYKICLPLELAASQAWYQTAWLDESYGCLCQP